MATHPKHAIDGNGNGNGNGNGAAGMTQKKLERLFAHHEGIANALWVTLRILRGEAVEARKQRDPAVLAMALDVDAERRAQRPKPRATYGADKKVKAARRARTAALLATFDLHKPKHGEGGRGVGVLVQHGFLKKKGDGYVRTDREFHV